jgi:pyruvate/2-oxoglutarate dehydrogenase complex dihydrolipoamide dehydrogenase (E3) component
LTREEPEVSQAAYDALAADGVQIRLNTRIQQVTQSGTQRIVTHIDGNNERGQSAVDTLLIAIGRQPNIEGLGLENIGVAMTPEGITVDAKQRTSLPHIFAVGDVVNGYRFTHVAVAQAGVAAPNALLPGFLMRTMRSDVMPWVTFIDPEIARVGLTESEARRRDGSAVRVQTLPFQSIDRAQTDNAAAGFIKLVLGKKDTILGAHIVGARAGDLLAEVTLAMRHGLTINDLIATIHAYPTYATGVQQVAFEAYLTGRSFARARAIIRRFLPSR